MSARQISETVVITAAALLGSMALFAGFMYVFAGVAPLDLFQTMYRGSFGSRSGRSDALSRAAPLILTALCTALPARLGLIVIGGEGALVLGGLAAVGVGLALAGTDATLVLLCMALAGMLAGGLLIGLAGALSHGRGVNATISSLLLVYVVIAIFTYLVEGPMKDPASLNKPSTRPVAEEVRVGTIKLGEDNLGVHWGLAYGVAFCLAAYVLMDHTTFGFAARMAGGNVRAALGTGLPVGRLIVLTCILGGAAAGLAGMFEIAAVHGQANATLIAGYGFTGILVSFIARHHPLAIIPTALLFGGINASNSALQRRLNLPDASVQVLMGIMFVVILLFETLYGRFRVFQPRELREAAPA